MRKGIVDDVKDVRAICFMPFFETAQKPSITIQVTHHVIGSKITSLT